MPLFQPNLFQTGPELTAGPTNLAAIMDAMAAAVPPLASGKVYGYPVEDFTIPAAIVGYPTTIDFDRTFARGSDRLVIPLFFIVGKVVARQSRNDLAEVVSGANEIKAALEANVGLLSVAQTVRVTDCRIESVTAGGIDYIAAIFDTEVIT